jgi:hypothetical protein
MGVVSMVLIAMGAFLLLKFLRYVLEEPLRARSRPNPTTMNSSDSMMFNDGPTFANEVATPDGNPGYAAPTIDNFALGAAEIGADLAGSLAPSGIGDTFSSPDVSSSFDSSPSFDSSSFDSGSSCDSGSTSDSGSSS